MIVDDNDRFARVARRVLEGDGIEVVGVAADCAQALAQTRDLRPDVMLIDVSLGEEFGVTLAEQIADRVTSPPIMILMSTYVAGDFDEWIETSPVAGFLPKMDLSGRAIHQIIDRAGR